MTDLSEAWGIGRRQELADRRAERQIERSIQMLRLLSVPLMLLQLAVYPGPVGAAGLAAVLVLLANAAWVAVVLRGGLEAESWRSLGWTSISGDVAVAVLLMINYRTNPGDAVQFVPLLMAVQAAARWGRVGGAVGGAVAGIASALWANSLHHEAGLDMPLTTLVFRVAVFTLVGLFVGMMVREARQQRRAAEAVLNASRDLVVSFSVDGIVRSVNPASERILGYRPEELIGMDRTSLLAPGEPTFGPVAVDLYRREGPQLVELRLLHRDGHVVWLELDLLPDLESGLVHAIGRDVSARRQAELELRRRADHDGLTGVWNRQALVSHLRGLFEQNLLPALVFIDLDRFKAVNDAHGHLAGDGVLREIAERLQGAADDQYRVARYAGDEFCLVVVDPQHLDDLLVRVRAALAHPLLLGGREEMVSASMGWAVSGTGDGPEDLLHRADSAMYVAKANGRH